MPDPTGAHRRARHLLDVLVPALLLVGLVLVTVSVVRGGVSAHVDAVVYRVTPGQGHGPVVLDLLALLVVDIATPPVWVAAVLLGMVGLWARTRRGAPLVLTGSAIGLLVVTVLLGKSLIARPGPGSSHVLGGLGSFPSGHTATALVCAGVVAELVSQARPVLRRAAWVAAGAWTLLVAVSLLWLHFHWLSDVVGSLLLGLLVLWLVLRWPLRLGVPIGRQWRHGEPGRGR